MERFVEERELQAAESMVTIQKIKSSIHHCYTSIYIYIYTHTYKFHIFFLVLNDPFTCIFQTH